MIKAVVVGDDRLKAWLKQRRPKLESAIVSVMNRMVMLLTRKIKEEKLSGQVLKNRTGRLRRSISPHVYITSGAVIGEVATNVEYASIHEYGGTTPPHDIYPKHGLALRWLNPGFQGPMQMSKSGKLAKRQSASAYVFARVVHHPGSKMPERSFMRTALAEMQPEIRSEFEKVIQEVIRP